MSAFLMVILGLDLRDCKAFLNLGFFQLPLGFCLQDYLHLRLLSLGTPLPLHFPC